MVFFAQLNEDIVIDKIPLDEIKQVREMEGVDEESKKSQEANELMVETYPDGYNSGRTYYIQTESRAMCRKMVRRLLDSSKKAHERAQAQTAFAHAQHRVGKAYRSALFQNFVALLIIAVRGTSHCAMANVCSARLFPVPPSVRARTLLRCENARARARTHTLLPVHAIFKRVSDSQSP